MPTLPHSHTLSLPHTHSHSLTHTHAHTHTHSHTHPPTHSPIIHSLTHSQESYGVTLGVLRRQAEMGGPIPFWAFFNAMPFSPAHSDPTEAMIRWQVQ